ncbi:serine O-acetyltransferase [Buchnera aphidicola]|uniref:Serine acetyltransferase n=1 Tax=Buchnera aphidicola (Lipaphis pseudobrassicae) TaxID=1258543 RepID=A0A4D6Y7W4_9GAMM|nr:serine O-acetyltransferase [Buchnera aphidicola]QCI21950.1 serine O-acetyltransferase [Buchnera aphidicola (Lipaphis pseudobrassicae)]
MCIVEISKIWKKIIYEVSSLSEKEPILSKFYYNNILKHKSLSFALSYILSNKLSTNTVSTNILQKIFNEIYLDDSSILKAVVQDLKAVLKRDPVINNYLIPFLYLKGFHALQSYRLSHYLWNLKNTSLSIYLQSRISTIFAVDIHPAASIGSGIMLDHATGIVIGEGTIVEDDVSIFHSVTLGSTGKSLGKDRHPTIRKGVVIGSGAKVLGNIEVGIGSKIGAGSIVLKNIPAYVTVVGIPAKIVSSLNSEKKYAFKKSNCSTLSLEDFYYYGDGI